MTVRVDAVYAHLWSVVDIHQGNSILLQLPGSDGMRW